MRCTHRFYTDFKLFDLSASCQENMSQICDIEGTRPTKLCYSCRVVGNLQTGRFYLNILPYTRHSRESVERDPLYTDILHAASRPWPVPRPLSVGGDCLRPHRGRNRRCGKTPGVEERPLAIESLATSDLMRGNSGVFRPLCLEAYRPLCRHGSVLCGRPANYILEKAAEGCRTPGDRQFSVDGAIPDVCE